MNRLIALFIGTTGPVALGVAAYSLVHGWQHAIHHRVTINGTVAMHITWQHTMNAAYGVGGLVGFFWVGLTALNLALAHEIWKAK